MKKGLLSLLCCSLILVLCGCNDETLKKEENNKVSTTNSCKLSTDVVFSYNNFKCPEMKDIKFVWLIIAYRKNPIMPPLSFTKDHA